MNNFFCPKCKKEVFIPSYSIKVKDGDSIYLEKGKEIKCSDCKVGLEPIPKEGEFNINYTKFFALPAEEKKKILKARSKRDYEKTYKEREILRDKGLPFN